MKKLTTAIILCLLFISSPLKTGANSNNLNPSNLELELSSAPKPPRVSVLQDPPRTNTDPAPDPEPEPDPIPDPEPEPEPEPEPDPEPTPTPEPPPAPSPTPPREPSTPTQPAPVTPRPSTPVESPDEEVELPVEIEEPVEEEEILEEEPEEVIDIDQHGDVLWKWKKEFKHLPLPILYDILKIYIEEDIILNLNFLTKAQLEELLYFLENEEIVASEFFDSLRAEISTIYENKEEPVEEPEEDVEKSEEVVLSETTTPIPLVEVSNHKKMSPLQKMGHSIAGFFSSIGAFIKGIFN